MIGPSTALQFSTGCWRARLPRPTARSARDLRRDSASCRDRGTTPRCALNAGAKALTVLELPALLIGFAFGRLGAASLWDAHDLDAFLLARHHVLLAEEAAIRSVQFGDVAEGLLVAFQ